MWLINTASLDLKNFTGEPPSYAILSHRWGSDKEEVSFQEWCADHTKIVTRPGYVKITKACDQAQKDHLGYLWVDTSCIDKNSSAELSEAINSMYQYYSEAQVCYTYLHDVTDLVLYNPNGLSALDSEFCRSSWFTRGWTLQELLASKHLVFYTASWAEIGTKSQLRQLISQITGICEGYLSGGANAIRHASISCRMSWISNRVTTRAEDIAYCMLGIFNIHMPLLYGERHQAFQRLQEKLIESSNDQTIFAWDWLPEDMETVGCRAPRLRAAYLLKRGWAVQDSKTTPDFSFGGTSIFAPDPVFFYNSEGFRSTKPGDIALRAKTPYTMTNLGLSITLPFYESCHGILGYIEARIITSLALVAPYRKEISFQDLASNSVSCLGFEVSNSGYGHVTCRRSATMASGNGSLLSINMPGHLFKKYFPPIDMFVPSTPWHRINSAEASVDLGVWCLLAEDGPRLSLFEACNNVGRVWGSGRMGSIFTASWRGEQLLVLVRAYRRSNKDGDILWDCRETKVVSQNSLWVKIWAFEGKELSLDQILDLDESVWLGSTSSSCLWDTKIGTKSQKFEIRLDGEVKWVSKPKSCIRFLHAVLLEGG